jgi:antitoxin HigA-1
MKNIKKLTPIHPGEVLKDKLLEIGMSANAVALALRIPTNRLTAIVNGKRAITADTAMRLAKFFGTSAQLWMNLQAKYDLEAAGDELAELIEREVQPLNTHAA